MLSFKYRMGRMCDYYWEKRVPSTFEQKRGWKDSTKESKKHHFFLCVHSRCVVVLPGPCVMRPACRTGTTYLKKFLTTVCKLCFSL